MKRINWVVIGCSALLCALGLMSLFSLIPPTDSKGENMFKGLFWKQCVFLAFGTLGMALSAFLPTHRLGKMSYALYVLGVLSLVGVLTLARAVRGVHSWYSIGSITIEPAEFAKVALVLAVARFMGSVERWRLPQVLELSAIAALPIGLTAVQPDFGLAFIMGSTFFIMLLGSEIGWKYIVGLVVILLAAAPVVWTFGLREFQKNRVLALVSPDKVSPEKRDQQQQAMKLTASGAIAGKGIGEAGLAYPYYLAERHNDFIYSVIGEEMGFAGTVLVILLFGVILYQVISIAARTRDVFTRMAALGSGAVLFMQTVVNVGMTLGLLPVTGLTLPFVSYGGSSLVSSFLVAGIILSCHAHWTPAFSNHALPESQYAVNVPRMR